MPRFRRDGGSSLPTLRLAGGGSCRISPRRAPDGGRGEDGTPMRPRVLLTSVGAVGLVLGGSALAAGVGRPVPVGAAAVAPPAPTVIKVCVNKKSGAMRWVSAGTSRCRSGETLHS